MANIKFINNASFIVEYNGVRLLADPWLKGNVFADGWSLLTEEVEAEDILSYDIDAILYTHEHPDHFSIYFLKNATINNKHKIPEIVYQKTNDKKLIKFCEKLNVKVNELTSGVGYGVSSHMKVKIYPYDKGDSVVEYILENNNAKPLIILNLNDCEFKSPGELLKFIVKNKINLEPDILFTQFSYACWQSNNADKNQRIIAAERKLNDIKNQINVLKPKLIMPFASFVYFSHKENESHNDAINTPERVSNWLLENGISNFHFMKPFDVIELGVEPDPQLNRLAINYWEEKLNLNNKKVKINSRSYSEEEILRKAYTYAQENQKFLKVNQ